MLMGPILQWCGLFSHVSHLCASLSQWLYLSICNFWYMKLLTSIGSYDCTKKTMHFPNEIVVYSVPFRGFSLAG